MGFARRLAGQAALLAGGRIVESGPAQQIFDHPATPQAADFLARVLKY
jgi:polar amino acid transport system ATP-binding protein